MFKYFFNRKGFHTLLEPFIELIENGNLRDTWHPPVDIFETDNSFCIISELAGVKKENINIMLKGRKLIINGEKKECLSKKYCEKIKFHRIERPNGIFRREITLPAYVETENMNVSYENGILEIIMKKHEKTIIRVE